MYAVALFYVTTVAYKIGSETHDRIPVVSIKAEYPYLRMYVERVCFSGLLESALSAHEIKFRLHHVPLMA